MGRNRTTHDYFQAPDRHAPLGDARFVDHAAVVAERHRLVEVEGDAGEPELVAKAHRRAFRPDAGGADRVVIGAGEDARRGLQQAPALALAKAVVVGVDLRQRQHMAVPRAVDHHLEASLALRPAVDEHAVADGPACKKRLQHQHITSTHRSRFGSK
jgi:hypothetical protein